MGTSLVDTRVAECAAGTLSEGQGNHCDQVRPAPYPLVQRDTGYGSDTDIHSNSLQNLSSSSVLGLANAVKCTSLLSNEANFAATSKAECYESTIFSPKKIEFDDLGLRENLASPRLGPGGEDLHRTLIIFTSLTAEPEATFRARSSLSKAAVEALISQGYLNPLFVPDLLGRPNYWNPELYSSLDQGGSVESVDFFCQYPRFSIHHAGLKQKSPVSTYVRRSVAGNTTTYIIAAPDGEECVQSFKNLLDVACLQKESVQATFKHPLEPHLLLMKMSCESSQGFIALFRQYMFEQLRAVDDLSAQETANRKGLADVTIALQIISKDANKLISDIDVASRNLIKMQEALIRLDDCAGLAATTTNTESHSHHHRQYLHDTLQYLTASMDKQKMWMQNYRDRKDIAMSLVFNLVTQQDAANNIRIAQGMKKDSSSMNGIALLTMVFLPGTFTSTILGAGLFTSLAQHRSINVSGLWWFWAAITFPLTGAVLLLWVLFTWRETLRRYADHTIRSLRSKSGLKRGSAEVDVDVDVEAKG